MRAFRLRQLRPNKQWLDLLETRQLLYKSSVHQNMWKMCLLTWISGLVFLGVNLLVGTESGLMLLDRSGQGKVYPLINRRRFQQMDVLEGLNVLVTISGKVNCWTLCFSSIWNGMAERFSWQPVYWGGSLWSQRIFHHFTSLSLQFISASESFSTQHPCLLAPCPSFCGVTFKNAARVCGKCLSLFPCSVFESWKLMFCEVRENVILSLCQDCFQPGLYLTKTQCTTWVFVSVKICRMGKALAK